MSEKNAFCREWILNKYLIYMSYLSYLISSVLLIYITPVGLSIQICIAIKTGDNKSENQVFSKYTYHCVSPNSYNYMTFRPNSLESDL